MPCPTTLCTDTIKTIILFYIGYVNYLTLPLKMKLKQTNLSIKENRKNILDYMRACNGFQKRYL